MLVLRIILHFLLIALSQQQDCVFQSHVDPFFFSAGSLAACTGDISTPFSCRMNNGDSMFLAACGSVKIFTETDTGGTDYSINEANGNDGKITFSCAGGSITASGQQEMPTNILDVTAIQFNDVCCRTEAASTYPDSVTRVFAPDTSGAQARKVAASADIQSCYHVDPAPADSDEVLSFCRQSAHSMTMTPSIPVSCTGTPGDVGTWAAFPACIPLATTGSAPCATMTADVDRRGGDMGMEFPVLSASDCCNKCLTNNSCYAATYVSGFMGCFYKTDAIAGVTPMADPGKFHGVAPGTEATIACGVATTPGCSKWCDSNDDCSADSTINDEKGCPTVRDGCSFTLPSADRDGFLLFNLFPAVACDGDLCYIENGAKHWTNYPFFCPPLNDVTLFIESSSTVHIDDAVNTAVESCINVATHYGVIGLSNSSLECDNGILKFDLQAGNRLGGLPDPPGDLTVTFSHINRLSCTSTSC